MEITLITGNQGKANELSQLLGLPIQHKKLTLTEIQTLDVEEVAKRKAKEAYETLRKPVFVDDTSFTILAWNGLPGPFIAWFLDRVGTKGILDMAQKLTDRRVIVTTVLGYADEDGIRVFKGSLEGELAETERGENGFGYDAIFIPAGHNKTFAEMTPQGKNEISMRRLAANEMKQGLGL